MIMSDRDVFTGTHLTPEVKDALRVFARGQNKSMSAVVYEAVVEKLKKEGVEIDKPREDAAEQKLPYETH
jgi:predicted transcriptional regulator